MKRVIIFVDYENITKIQLKDHPELTCVLYVFVGNKQKSIPTATLVNISSYSKDPTFIQINGTAKDNLDFHLCAELGIVHTQEPLSTEFVILSKDTGFDGVIKYFKTQKKRQIKRLTSLSSLFSSKTAQATTSSSPQKASSTQNVSPAKPAPTPVANTHENMAVLYGNHLLSMQSKARPRKVDAVKNDIRTFFKKEKISAADIEKIFNLLVKKVFILCDGNSKTVSYPQDVASTQIQKMATLYQDHLVAVKSTKRPRKIKTLKNDIGSFFKKEKVSPLEIEQVYHLLLKGGLFVVDSSSSRVTYPKGTAKQSKKSPQNTPQQEVKIKSPSLQAVPHSETGSVPLLLPDVIEDMAILYSKRLLGERNGHLPHNVKHLKDDIVIFFKDQNLSVTEREDIYRCLIKKGIFHIDKTTNTLTYPWSN